MPEPLTTPRAGLPELVSTPEGLEDVIKQMREGHGPIAIDAERASGYRYSQRAYLIQIFRRGGGLHLIDPVAANAPEIWCEMSEAFADQEWIIHASTQDLPCLREVGLAPERLFDTELGGRIAGCERVGLGPLAESLLDISLAKEHSAVDWSIRPLKEEWLNYAALDVDVLIDLRDKVEELLQEQGKLEWALQDFATIIKSPPPPPKKDLWRRTSGMHKVRDRLTLAIIRDLWAARNEFAQEIDIAAGRVFNDDALVEVATKRPKVINDFAYILTKRTRVTGQPIEKWFDVYRAALLTAPDDQPELRVPSTGLPPVKIWSTRNAPGYARVTHARAAMIELAAEHQMPTENLISPEIVRRIAWAPPADLSALDNQLAELGARSWQIELVTPALRLAMTQTEPLVVETPDAPADGESSEE